MKKNKLVQLPKFTWVVLTLLIAGPCELARAVKMLGVKIPAFIFMGDSVQLFCDYDMQMDNLYSITWYKDNEEFYRFVPSSIHLKHSYHMDGITVDNAHSDSKKVTLRYANLLMNGEYKCEVSAEAPFFTTVHAESKMAIVSLPKLKDLPRILGGNGIYKSGDIVYLNCTSGKSYPAAKLRWYVNNDKIKPSYEHTEKLYNGLYVTVSMLNLSTNDDYFKNGKIKVTCQAVINIGRQKASPPPKEYKYDTVLLVCGSATTFTATFDFKIILLTLTILVCSVEHLVRKL